MKVKHFNLNVGEQLFKALGDASRLRILFLIYKNKEMCVSDLELVLDFTQTKISRHLAYLRNAGIVNYRKMDQWAFYSIKDELSEFIDQIFRYLSKDPDLQNDLKIYNTLLSNRELAANRLLLGQTNRWR
ncbi:MAG: metalloregulator ArsR/SmtB family transcription factor [Cytophagales bacterium]|nr:metalloregulator ArsR/SmtB family transcription factor [Bernardetiaceae bacterium]MDW8210717.1 metalloregulator ArsR/SmtB family transcription factor [Cytophagales bacterium]